MTNPTAQAARRAAERCPTCGQVVPPKRRLLDAERLLRLLTHGEPHRQVYRDGKDLNRWLVTYGGGEADPCAVAQLIREGKVRAAYSNLPDDCFHVGRTIDVERTNAARDAQGKHTPLVYLADELDKGADDQTKGETDVPSR